MQGLTVLVFLKIFSYYHLFQQHFYFTPNFNSEPPKVCKNMKSQKECVSWKNKGHCKGENEAFMKKNCKVACGHCTPKGKNVKQYSMIDWRLGIKSNPLLTNKMMVL